MRIHFEGGEAGTITWEVPEELVKKVAEAQAVRERHHAEQALHAMLMHVAGRFLHAVFVSLERNPANPTGSLEHLGTHLFRFPHGGAMQASQMGDD